MEHTTEDVQLILDHSNRLLHHLHAIHLIATRGVLAEGSIHILLDADIVHHQPLLLTRI